jgi:hypothetical protein
MVRFHKVVEKATEFQFSPLVKVLESSIFTNAVPVLKADRSNFNWRT